MSTFLTPSDAEVVATVRAVNTATVDRSDVVTVVLPFAPGTYRGGPLTVQGRAVDVSQLGPSWPDGSWRTARAVLPPVSVQSKRELRLQIDRGFGTRTAFAFGRRIEGAAANLRLWLDVAGTVAVFGAWELIESSHLLAAFRARLRVPGTPVWAELTLEVGHGRNHARFWLHYGTSDPTQPEVTWQLGPVSFGVAGPSVVVYHGRDRGGRPVRLEDGGQWCEGQSQLAHGVLVFGEGAAPSDWRPILAVAESWPASGAFGPWGYVPPAPEDLSDPAVVQRIVDDDRARWRAADPWEWPLHGCAPTPNTTGDQADFSSVVMTLEAHGHPGRLHSIQRSVYLEACRPTHLREPDGSPLAFSQYPDILLWQGRIDHRITRDKRGKVRDINTGDPRTAPGGMAWWGHDRQHWSVNYLATYALLTGDRWALEECQHKTELWLGEMRIKSGSPVLDGMGAGRAVGRTLQAGTLLWLVTGRQDLADRIRDRVDVTVAQWTGAWSAPVQPPEVRGPYPGNIDGQTSFWMAWQAGFFVIGLDAVSAVFGNPPARAVADMALGTLMTWGVVRKDPTWQGDDAIAALGSWPETGPWTAGKAVEWFAGGDDPRARGGRFHRYDPYLLWVAPAVQIAAARGDGNAQAIIRQVRAGATSPQGRWRTTEWLGLAPGVGT